MPEVAELKHSRDLIRSAVGGRWVTRFQLTPGSRFSKRVPDGFEKFQSFLPARVSGVDTRGKFMWWTFENRSGETFRMWCTYGMSGSWSTRNSKHTGATVTFHDLDGTPRMLHFNDPRHFGTLKFVKSEVEHNKKLATLGPCILESQVTPEIFAERLLRKPRRTISEALLDQSGVAGVGNYIRAECLHRSGISPWREVENIKPDEWRSLCRETLAVVQESYRNQGATISTYRTMDGEPGEMQFFFRVYAKETCPKGHAVKRETTPEGRTAHWCPTCQT